MEGTKTRRAGGRRDGTSARVRYCFRRGCVKCTSRTNTVGFFCNVQRCLLLLLLLSLSASMSSGHAEVEVPSYTYQCMYTELNWRGGQAPYTVWFSRDIGDNSAPAKDLGAWYNVTKTSYMVPLIAPAGERCSAGCDSLFGLIEE